MNLDELEKRIKAIEDLEEIKKLHRNYISCLDNLEFKKALDFFTEDAEVEVRSSGAMKGKENFSKIYLETLAQRKERHDGHLVGQAGHYRRWRHRQGSLDCLHTVLQACYRLGTGEKRLRVCQNKRIMEVQ